MVPAPDSFSSSDRSDPQNSDTDPISTTTTTTTTTSTPPPSSAPAGVVDKGIANNLTVLNKFPESKLWREVALLLLNLLKFYFWFRSSNSTPCQKPIHRPSPTQAVWGEIWQEIRVCLPVTLRNQTPARSKGTQNQPQGIQQVRRPPEHISGMASSNAISLSLPLKPCWLWKYSREKLCWPQLYPTFQPKFFTTSSPVFTTTPTLAPPEPVVSNNQWTPITWKPPINVTTTTVQTPTRSEFIFTAIPSINKKSMDFKGQNNDHLETIGLRSCKGFF